MADNGDRSPSRASDDYDENDQLVRNQQQPQQQRQQQQQQPQQQQGGGGGPAGGLGGIGNAVGDITGNLNNSLGGLTNIAGGQQQQGGQQGGKQGGEEYPEGALQPAQYVRQPGQPVNGNMVGPLIDTRTEEQKRLDDVGKKYKDDKSSLKIRIELDIDVEVHLSARVKGDITIGLL